MQSPREVFKLRKVRGSLIVASLSVKRAVGEAKGRDPPSRREEAQGTWSGPGQLVVEPGEDSSERRVSGY